MILGYMLSFIIFIPRLSVFVKRRPLLLLFFGHCTWILFRTETCGVFWFYAGIFQRLFPGVRPAGRPPPPFPLYCAHVHFHPADRDNISHCRPRISLYAVRNKSDVIRNESPCASKINKKKKKQNSNTLFQCKPN